MKIPTIIPVLLALLSIPAVASASSDRVRQSVFPKQDSRKRLVAERDSLMKELDARNEKIDSLLLIIDAFCSSPAEEEDAPFTFGIADTLYTDEVSTDSLLSLWYNRKDMQPVEMEPADIDSMSIQSDIPDSVYIDRLQKMNSFISLPYNRTIRNHIVYYTTRMPDKMETILGLGNYYMPIFEEIFDEHGLPVELSAMAVIESALNIKAVSRARAKGMWQFMYGTAKRYNLTINSYVDERFDPVTSAHAAAEYLKDSYRIFGDWVLAIASYNCGAGNVNKAIRRSGGSRDFWEIYPYLPRETRGYVPSFIAALYTMKYYREHNLTPKRIEMTAHLDTLVINRMLHFDQISHFTGASIGELRRYNPQYLHDIIPGVEREYILRLPFQYTAAFIDHEDEIYGYRDSVYFSPGALKKIESGTPANSTRIVHRVKKGETLSHLSYKYGVKIKDIQRWNGIGTGIRAGQRLVIYTGGKGAPVGTGTSVSGGYEYYTIQRGDNLWDIAKKFRGVTVNELMKLNGLTAKSRIYPGDRIKIRKTN